MRKLFITDIHGEFEGMRKLLAHARFEPGEDQLVIGGDLVSRGPDSALVLEEARSLALRHPEHVRVLIGNHEEMMVWHYEGKSDLWLSHAGSRTIDGLNRLRDRGADRWRDVLDWCRGLPLLFEDDEFVYAHAGLDPHIPLMEQDRETLWMPESDFYGYPRELILERTGGKPVIHGHTPCEYIYGDGARMNCDLGAHTYSIVEERALALVDLSNRVYYVYKIATGRISERRLSFLS